MSTQLDRNLTRTTEEDPCLHCGKHGWCYTIGELSVCKHENPPADGWVATSKMDGDGSLYYAPIQEKSWEARSPRVIKKSVSKPKSKPATIPIGLKLLQLAEQAWDCPEAGEPNYRPKGVPSAAKLITYKYSESQEVDRFEWLDAENPKGRDKTYRQRHIDADGNWKAAKGNRVWPAYRIDEVIEDLGDVALNEAVAVLMLEGEPNIELARSNGIVATTLQGSAWGNAEIEAMVSALRATGKNIALTFLHDNDSMGIKKALLVKSACDRTQFPCIIINPLVICPEIPDKGDIKEILDSMDSEEFIRKLEAEIHRSATPAETEEEAIDRVDREGQMDGDEGGNAIESLQKRKESLPGASITANIIAEDYRDKLAWESEYQMWRHYGAEHDGCWDVTTEESVRELIHCHIEALEFTYSSGYVSSALTILKSKLEARKWNEQPGLIPLRDGVLDQKTLKLSEHAPGYRLTWQLPFKWADRVIGCAPIEEFLLKISGHPDIAEVLLAYLAAIVTGRADLQRYLELIGGGQTGKSTYMRLAKALIGEDNAVSSQLKLLESNQFETARFYRKKLILFSDSDRWQGEVSVLKQLTGQDPIRYERKGIQQCRDFTYGGMVILSANEAPQSADRTSGQERRKLTIALDTRCPEYEGRELTEEFAPYLPGLLARVLAMRSERVTELIKYSDRSVPALSEKKWSQLTETNPIAEWLDDRVVVGAEFRTHMGTNNPDRIGKWLYANFCQFQAESGYKQSIPNKRFSNNLKDLLKNQLKLSIKEGRDRDGSYIEGIGLRCLVDPSNLLPRPVTKKLFDCDGSVTGCDGSVTAETLTDVGFVGCDGFLESSEKLGEKIIAVTVLPTSPLADNVIAISKSEAVAELGENPSNPSHPTPVRVSAVTNPSQTHHNRITNPIGDALNESELELIEFIRGCEDMEGAIDIQKILTDCCDQDEADRGKIWAALNSEERSKYKSLLNPPQPAPESIAPPTETGSNHKNLKVDDRVVITDHDSIHKGQIGIITDISYRSEADDYRVELDKPSHSTQSVMIEIPHNARTPLLMRLTSEELPKNR